MAKTNKTYHKKKPAKVSNFEPTRVALVTSCLGVSVIVLLAVIAVTTL